MVVVVWWGGTTTIIVEYGSYHGIDNVIQNGPAIITAISANFFCPTTTDTVNTQQSFNVIDNNS